MYRRRLPLGALARQRLHRLREVGLGVRPVLGAKLLDRSASRDRCSKNGVSQARSKSHRLARDRARLRRRRGPGRRPGRDRDRRSLRTPSATEGCRPKATETRLARSDIDPRKTTNRSPHLQNNAPADLDPSTGLPSAVLSSWRGRGGDYFVGLVQRHAVAAAVLRFVERLVGEADDVVGVLDGRGWAAPRRRR